MSRAFETVTILFTDLVGSTELATRVGPTPAERLRQEHFSVLRSELEHHGGVEVKTLGDGLMIAFTSAASGVQAAVAIQQAIYRRNRNAEHQLAIRMGLALGDAMAEAGDYYGAPVVEAARLCELAAGGQILVTELVSLAAAAHHTGGLRPLGPQQLKGLPAAMSVFEVQWSPATGGTMQLPPSLRTVPEVSYVGRALEREEIRTAWAEAAAGARRALLICGEPGIGKTRLATHGAFMARESGAAVLCGRSDHELAVPYQPWIDIVSHAIQHGHREVVEAELARSAAELATLVPALVGDRVGERATTDAETERYRLFDAVASLLAALAEVEPLFIILDDLHWADRPSLLLLRHLLRTCEDTPVLVVCTYRDSDLTAGHPLRDAIADLRRMGGVSKIALEGLREQDLIDLLEAVTGQPPTPEGNGLAAELRRETGGNPFFVSEMLRHLLEAGLVATDSAGRWGMTKPLAEVGLPESLREVIGARVDALGDTAATLLRTAAVVGREFDLHVLAGVSGLPAGAVLDALEAAISASLLVERPSEEGGFAFVHSLIRQTLYEEMSQTRRSVLHEEIARVLERLPSAERDSRLGELVHHWSTSVQASREDKVVDYARLAGRRALDSLAPDAAVRFFTQAVDHLGADRRSPTGLELLIELGSAEQQSGSPTARETLIGASRLARDLAAPQERARALLTLSRLWPSLAGVDRELVAELEGTLPALTNDDETRPEIEAMLACELTYDAPLERRVELFMSALDSAERHGALAPLARVMVLGLYSIFAPDTIAWRRRLEPRLLEVAGASGPLLDFHARWRVLHRSLEDGDLAAYDAILEDFDRLAPQLPHPAVRWSHEFAKAFGLIIRGQLEEAEQQAFAAFGVGEGVADDAFTILGAELINIRWEQGRIAELTDALGEAVELNPHLPAFCAIHANALAEGGRLDEARPKLEAAHRTGFADIRLDNTGMAAVLMWAEVARATGHPEAAAELDVWMERRNTGPIVWNGAGAFGPVSRIEGVLAETQGDRPRAIACYEAAQELALRIGAPLFAARASWDLGRVLLADEQRDRGLRELAAAEETWQRLGVETMAERARAAIAV